MASGEKRFWIKKNSINKYVKNNKLTHWQQITSLFRYDSWTLCYATRADAVHLNSIGV